MSQLLHIYTKSVLNMPWFLVQWGGKKIICAVTVWCYYISLVDHGKKDNLTLLNDQASYKIKKDSYFYNGLRNNGPDYKYGTKVFTSKRHRLNQITV